MGFASLRPENILKLDFQLQTLVCKIKTKRLKNNLDLNNPRFSLVTV